MKGHVRRRGRVWAFWVDLGADPATGKRRRRSRSGFKTQREASEAMRALLRAVESGTVATGEVPTLAAFVRDDWLPGRRPALRPSTWNSYRDVLEGRVLPRLGALRVDRITKKHVADMLDELGAEGGRDARRAAGLSPRTVRYTLMVLTRVLGDAMKDLNLPRNVAAEVERPKVRDQEMCWWSIAEARSFLAHVGDDRLYALWAFHYAGFDGAELRAHAGDSGARARLHR